MSGSGYMRRLYQSLALAVPKHDHYAGRGVSFMKHSFHEGEAGRDVYIPTNERVQNFEKVP